jgi:hypothetical protein
MEVVVLKTDWEGGVDPVPYYSADPAKGCLNFNSSHAKPRSKLTEDSRGDMKDCEHGVTYNVVLCSVLP